MASRGIKKRKNGGFSSCWSASFDPTIHPLFIRGEACLSPYLPKLLEGFGTV
jgi:hypothetical protein